MRRAARRHVRRGQAGRRVAPDRVARDQRLRPGARGDARARARGDAHARLPAQPGRAGARHRPVEDDRRGELRHDALRARVDALRDRARGARGGLLHEHRQPASRSTAPSVLDGRRAAARPGRRRHPRDRAAAQRGARRRAAAGRPRGGGRRGRPGRRGAGRGRRPVRRRGRRHAAPARARPPDRLAHRRPGRLAGVAPARRRLAARAAGGRRRGARPRSPATGARAPATSSGSG